MFSGIIETTGKVQAIEQLQYDSRFAIYAGSLPMEAVRAGDSIAINGVCLTVVEFDQSSFELDVSAETLSVTNLGLLQQGSKVNLERALQLSDRLHGHIVTGHVDAMGKIISMEADGRSMKYIIEVPELLQRYISKKGSVCVDGVSLTINENDGQQFSVNIIPHTMEKTIIGDYQTGTMVNIEVDIIARYLESLHIST